MSVIQQGGQQTYSRFTSLEGWSMYDIDAELVRKGWASSGAYIQAVQNQQKI